MSTIDLGLFLPIPHSLDSAQEVENSLLLCLATLFQKADVKFISTYIYNEKTDIGIDMFALNESLKQIITSNSYNKITFIVNEENLFVSIGFIEEGITIGINVDYNFCTNIWGKVNPISLICVLQENICNLHEKIRYKFAFADFDAEFDYSYSQLLVMIKDKATPYCLLIIEDHGELIKCKSPYDLLGCPYDTKNIDKNEF